MALTAYGADEIRRVEHYGKYTTTFAVPKRFIWELEREREVECPLVEWRIGERWFRAVIPIEPNIYGCIDHAKAEKKLVELIAESRGKITANDIEKHR